LKIISPKEVELAEGTPATVTTENYAEYSVIIRTHDGKREIARVTADRDGNSVAKSTPLPELWRNKVNMSIHVVPGSEWAGLFERRRPIPVSICEEAKNSRTLARAQV